MTCVFPSLVPCCGRFITAPHSNTPGPCSYILWDRPLVPRWLWLLLFRAGACFLLRHTIIDDGGRRGWCRVRRLDLPRSFGTIRTSQPFIATTIFQSSSGCPFASRGRRLGRRSWTSSGILIKADKVLDLAKMVAITIALSTSSLEGINFFLRPHHLLGLLLCVFWDGTERWCVDGVASLTLTG